MTQQLQIRNSTAEFLIFQAGATTEKISVVQTEGERQVTRLVLFYNLDAISIGL